MKVGTFFSGVGSPEQALRNLGIKHEIEFACDIDKYAKQTYLKNFKPKLFATDITALDMKELPYVDLLVFGFPCQAFSMAGNRKGFDDTRGTLFYDALRYLKDHTPRYFIAENVKGLVSHDNGKTFHTIIDCLAKTTNYQMRLMPFDNLGYHIHYKVLNTKNFGIPQNRERIFIIGIRDDEDNNFTFPKEILLELKLKDILQDNPTYAKECKSAALRSYPRTSNPDKDREKGRVKRLEVRADDVANSITTHESDSLVVSADSDGKVDDKYYLSDKAIAKIKRHNNKSINNDLSNCIHAGYYKQGGRDQQYIQAIELKRLEDVKLTATKRVNETPKEINEFLRKHKNISIQEIADKLNIPKTQAEHYFRTDKSRAIPSREIWNKLKELLNFDSRYDKQVCQIEQSEYTFESACRLYSDNGLGATLQTTENTLYKTQNRIRRLTPIECERLQGFPDNFTEGVSDTQRYKQMGNTITVNVIQAILKNLIK
jgi:DNA-cytosine methyltransferase